MRVQVHLACREAHLGRLTESVAEDLVRLRVSASVHAPRHRSSIRTCDHVANTANDDHFGLSWYENFNVGSGARAGSVAPKRRKKAARVSSLIVPRQRESSALVG